MEARIQFLKNRFFQLRMELGNALMPALERLVAIADPLIMFMKGWVAEHPRLTSGIVLTAAALGGLSASILGTLVAAHGLLVVLQLSTVRIGLLRLAGAMAALGRVTGVTAAAQWLWNTAMGFGRGIALGTRIQLGLLAIQQVALRVATAIGTAVQWLFNVALTANPIGLIIAGIALLVAAIVGLVVYWDKIIAAMRNASIWIKLVGVGFALMLGPIGLVAAAIAGLIVYWDDVIAVAKKAWGWTKKLFGIKARML